MNPQKIVILGSTGSIGVQALDIIRQNRDRFEVVGLSCNRNWEKLAEQVREFSPSYALLCAEEHKDGLEEMLGQTQTDLLFGGSHLKELAQLDEADIILNSLVGFSGFEPTMAALHAGKKVALANKESLVAGGALIKEYLGRSSELPGNRPRLVPIDSEHSAMLQCLTGEPHDQIEKIIITASGGPFRTWSRQQMEKATVEDALNHPNWSMGAKITVDSATMMNKGLEIIEAHWLFNLPPEMIEPVIHPESIIHSVVTFKDGSSKAQLGPPDMKVPIQYALSYPGRYPMDVPRLDWSEVFQLTFEPVDYQKFPCVDLALQALKTGGFAPAVLNAANEIAVEQFLNREIPYIGISKIVETSLGKIQSSEPISLDSLKEIDRQTRNFASHIK